MDGVLQQAWERRAELRAEAYKLYVKGHKLTAENEKIWAEGDRLGAEAAKLWAEAILSIHGDIALEWRWNDAAGENDCILETGEHFVAVPTERGGK